MAAKQQSPPLFFLSREATHALRLLPHNIDQSSINNAITNQSTNNPIRSVLYLILSSAALAKLSPETLLAELSYHKSLAPHAKHIAAAYSKLLPQLASPTMVAQYCSLQSLRWRLDVVISTTSLKRVFKPALLLQFKLSSGAVITAECPLKQFHKLRHAVATAINRISQIENHPLYKIQ